MGRVARTIMKEPAWYVPDIEDNRADPDPFRVQISPMSGAELNELEATQGKFTKGASVNFVKRGQLIVERLFSNRVHAVEGYSIAGETPKDGAALYRAIMTHGDESEVAIIDDIVDAVKNASKLDDGLLEKLTSQSGSQHPETRSSGGAARDAAGTTRADSPMSNGAKPETAIQNPIPASDLLGHRS